MAFPLIKRKKAFKQAVPAKMAGAQTRVSLERMIIIFSAIILLLNALVIINRGVNSYEESIHESEDYADRLMHTLSDHVELTFLAVDITLRRAVEKQYFNSLFGNNLLQDVMNYYTAGVNETPQISLMLMADETGAIKVMYGKEGYRDVFAQDESMLNKPMFLLHQNTDDPDLLGITPYKLEGRDPFIVLSRRINKIDGTFGGVALAVINTRYVMDYFSSVEEGKNTKLTIIKDDQTILINQVQNPQEIEMLYNLIENKVEYTATKSRTTSAIKDKNLDNQYRVVTLERIPSLGITVTTIMYSSDIFADWRASRVYDLVFLGMFALFVLVISFFASTMAKQVRRVQESEKAAVTASQAKSDFLAKMSHELRTPLNAIIGFSEMLDTGYFGKLNTKQKERVHDINLCGNHLLELINDILEFSKGEAGKLELREEKVQIAEIVEEAIRIITPRAKKGMVEVTSKVNKDFPYILADARKIKQVLLNLLANSVRFTPENGSVEIACVIDDNKNIVLTVTDSGIGMAQEDIPRALSVFGQVHSDAAYGGTGLGLPLCKMFAELHGGALKIQSIQGVGTKVFIILPSERVIWSQTRRVQELFPTEDKKTTIQ